MPYTDVNILVVEDQRPFLILLKGLLTNLGAKDVMTANQAEQAVRFCRNHQVDIVVCDLHLGNNKKNGFELYQELMHRKLISPGTVFLLISADATRPVVLGSIEHKPDDYLLKPFSQAQLKSRLNRSWQRKQYFKKVLLALSKQDYISATAELDAMHNMPAPYQRVALEIRLEILWRQQRYQQALALLQGQTEQLPSQWAQLALGKTYLAMQQFDDAIKCAKKVLLLNQFDPEALDILAQAKSAQQHPDEALEHIRQAIKNSPYSLQRQMLAARIARDSADYELLTEATRATWQLSKNTIFKNVNYWCNHISSLLDAAEAAESKNHRHRYQQEALLQLQRAPQDEALNRLDEPFSLDIFDQIVHARMDAIDGKLINAKRTLMDCQNAIDKEFELYPASLAPSSLQLMVDLGEFDEVNRLLTTLANQQTELEDSSRLLVRKMTKQVKASEQQYTHINRRGIQLYQQEKFADAKAAFNSALALSPVNAGIALNLLQCLIKLVGNPDEDDAALIKEARQVYKILSNAPMREQHQSKFDGLKGELARVGITAPA
ncbi:response regulator [Alteromonas lipolytica]|uniref:Response regulatory domain-containing protein n=1 Tax=Alteromonas lipolytica TaxID=1856405 RepID=A0A1E8FIU4_9ALTE|nr:response regulator [Alteromonas lipolytica]OFI35373.1 hypothetical protein BFC17_16365 [Alteromonas lipolytica]